jgi:uncharacterized membrane protein
MYGLLATTYYSKTRRKVLVLNLFSTLASAIAYIFLNAWSGLTTCIISIARNIVFLVDEKKNGIRENINRLDIMTLVGAYVLLIISAVFTYDGFFSLFSIFATMLYTFSVFQKKTTIYKLLGIPGGIAWIVYNIYIMSIFGIMLESILLVASITGYIMETKKNKLNSGKNELLLVSNI